MLPIAYNIAFLVSKKEVKDKMASLKLRWVVELYFYLTLVLLGSAIVATGYSMHNIIFDEFIALLVVAAYFLIIFVLFLSVG